MRFADLLFFLGAALFLSSCDVTDRKSARVWHTWGQTRRGTISLPQGRICEPEFTLTPEARRLSRLASRIAESNPQTFSGPLDVSKLCIGVDPSLQVIDARTTPEALRVAFSPQLVSLAQSDGELAAVLSHELAHIAMQHKGFSEFPSRMEHDEEFLRLKVQGKFIQDQIVELANAKADPTSIFVLNEQFAKILSQINERIDEVYGEANAHFNWTEQEADDVGAEFFVRSGFLPEDFISILWSSHPQEHEQREACELLIQNVLRSVIPEARPERGMRSHPSTCWRVFHLKIDEWAHTHSKDLGTIKPD